jgi:Phosphoesterase family
MPITARWARYAPYLCSLLLLWAPLPSAWTAEGRTGNLLVNGDAEAHECTDDWTAQTPVPGWRVVRGAASVLCHSAFAYTGETLRLPAGAAGRALFASPGIDTALEQTVDVTEEAQAIDRGAVHYELSGWLGGWRGKPGGSVVTAVFLDDRGHASGPPVAIGGDLPAGHPETILVARRSTGWVPAGTRRIVVTVDFPSAMVSFGDAYADNLRLDLVGDVERRSAPAPAPSAARIPALDHVFVVMMENTNFADVVHRTTRGPSVDPAMPFLRSLAAHGVLLGDLWATYHPSDQNYVAMVAGDTFKYGPVYYPDYDLAAPHLGDLLDARGRSWRAYVQHMNTPCNLVPDAAGTGNYAPDDQPFAHFHDVIANPSRCAAVLRDLRDFGSAIASETLPDFAWIAADGWWDGEGAWYDNFDMDTSLVRQDEFLRATVAPLLASRTWRGSRSLLIVTWDESLGWGWPDNHVPTVLVGSPGLLREGTVSDTHYDAYGLLRTVEEALGLGDLGRFDRYAAPLGEVFAASAAGDSPSPELHPSIASATRGSIRETFGQVGVPAAVYRGASMSFSAPAATTEGATVVVTPLGSVPTPSSPRWPVGAEGRVALSTANLSPGAYGAWLESPERPPTRAAVPFRVLPATGLDVGSIGVAIVGADPGAAEGGVASAREGSNVTVRYCRPPDPDGRVWVGVFPEGTATDQRTKDNALAIGYWLKTPGDGAGWTCGEAMAATSEMTPGTVFRVQLLRDEGIGTQTAIGRSATLTITPSLPH